MSSNEYTLDFVIPAGPTGPVGPSGVSSLCYVQFADSTSTGNMLIGTSTILPITSTDYIVSPNTIQINSPGYYEIVFCGKINRNTANKQIDVHLMCNNGGVTSEMPGMYGQWTDGSQVIHFSQTSIFHFENSVTLSVVVSINGTTTFNISSTSLIIKKLSF